MGAVANTPPDSISTPSGHDLVVPVPSTDPEPEVIDILENRPTLLDVAAMGDPSVDIH